MVIEFVLSCCDVVWDGVRVVVVSIDCEFHFFVKKLGFYISDVCFCCGGWCDVGASGFSFGFLDRFYRGWLNCNVFVVCIYELCSCGEELSDSVC